MRVILNGEGSEVLFTLFQAPDMSDEAFAEDAKQVKRDLATLKVVLEDGVAGKRIRQVSGIGCETLREPGIRSEVTTSQRPL